MTNLLLCGILVPIIIVIYSALCWSFRKVTYPMKFYNFEVIDEKFYKLQLIFSIIIGLALFIVSYIFKDAEGHSFYSVTYLLSAKIIQSISKITYKHLNYIKTK